MDGEQLVCASEVSAVPPGPTTGSLQKVSPSSLTSATAGLASNEERIDLVAWFGELLASGED